MRAWYGWAFVALVGCGGAAAESPASGASYYGGGGGAAAGEARTEVSGTASQGVGPAAEAPPPDEDARFGDQPDEPPPPPTRPPRAIDREGQGEEVADLGKHPIDTSPPPMPGSAASGSAAGGAAGGQGTPATTKPAPTTDATEAPHKAAMLVYTARITLAVYQVEPALDTIEHMAKDMGGYLATRTDRQITIRVPRARFADALKQVEATGDVLHREVTAEDVTDQFMDLSTRLKNARAMQERLRALLEKASVKDALAIEKELGRITEQIELMEGKLKLLRDRIAYSSITASFEPRGAAAVRDVPLRLPFPWLSGLGLPRLLSLSQ